MGSVKLFRFFREFKGYILGFLIAILVVLLVFMAIGPQRFKRYYKSWMADAYGSDWLVVQYTIDGAILNFWQLQNKSIGNEENSDGIYFLAGDLVIHLSMQYNYCQILNNRWDKAKKELLDGRKKKTAKKWRDFRTKTGN